MSHVCLLGRLHAGRGGFSREYKPDLLWRCLGTPPDLSCTGLLLKEQIGASILCFCKTLLAGADIIQQPSLCLWISDKLAAPLISGMSSLKIGASHFTYICSPFLWKGSIFARLDSRLDEMVAIGRLTLAGKVVEVHHLFSRPLDETSPRRSEKNWSFLEFECQLHIPSSAFACTRVYIFQELCPLHPSMLHSSICYTDMGNKFLDSTLMNLHHECHLNGHAFPWGADDGIMLSIISVRD